MYATRLTVLAVLAGFILTPASLAGDKERIAKAVERGVAFVKRQQNQHTGQWNYVLFQNVGQPAYVYGMTALAALTLMECDVPGNDSAVQQAVDFIRRGADHISDTYSLSLCIMFLDKLAEKRDESLIKRMAQRLVKGQLQNGGWTYQCPIDVFGEMRELKGGDQGEPKKDESGSARPMDTPTSPDVEGNKARPMPPTVPRMQDMMRKAYEERMRQGVPLAPGGAGLGPNSAPGIAGDNSNTQFATLGLWVARRHHASVDASLEKIGRSFSLSQHLDGGWSYIRRAGGPGTPSMTCAGLIGLAVGHGLLVEKKKDKVLHDPQVLRGFTFLKDSIASLQLRGADTIGIYYFLWSLERTAVIYDVQTIAGLDWYKWGSRYLLLTQNVDGSWRGKYSLAEQNQSTDAQSCAETCFALMFLKRANVVADLSRALRGGGDPGEHRLRGSAEDTTPIARRPGTTKSPTNRTGSAEGHPTEPTWAPKNSTDTSASGQLVTDVLTASGDQQKRLLEEYRDGKGTQYTDALAGAIHRLSGEAREKARDALANRLTRMTVGTLRAKLQDEDREVRSAAALACGMKQDQALVPDLIEAIAEPDGRVAQAARIALESLTGKKDFGPASTATRAQREAAARKWREWWQQQNNR